MATWPSGSKASTANLDAGTDKPSLARADIKQNVDNVNDIIDMFNISGPTNNQILKYNSTNTRFELASDADLNTTYTISAITDGSDANIRLTGSDASIDEIQLIAGTNISLAVTSAGAIQINNTQTELNTTYSVSAETVAGGANLRLTGSDTSTDDVKIASGTGITVSRTDANTITVTSTVTDTNTTYSIAAITDGADANIRLTGSDASVDEIQLIAGSNITLGVTSAGAIQISAAGSTGMTSFTVAADSGASQTIENGNTLTIVGGTNISSVASATDTVTLNLDATLTGLTAITATTVNTDAIVGVTTNGAITITPNGTGDVNLDADTVRIGDANTNAVLTTNGTGNLTISTNSGTNSGTITIVNGINGDISFQPNGTGDVKILADTTLIGDDNVNAVLTTNGTGNLTISTNNGTNSGTIVIAQGSNGDITVTPNGTGTVDFADKVLRRPVLKDYAETVYNLGNSGGTLALDPANGNLQRIRLTSSWTFTGFTGGVSGHSVTVLVQQDGTGGRTFTESLSSNNAMVWAGGTSTLSTGANAIDMLTIVLIDSVYYASLSKGFV